MKKTDGRSVAGREDRRFRQSVKAGSCRTQTAVWHIGSTPISGIIVPTPPSDAVLLRQQFVETLHAGALNAAQLLDRTTFGSGLTEPHRVHLAHNLESHFIVEREAGLIEQAIRAGTTRLTGCIESDAGFADP